MTTTRAFSVRKIMNLVLVGTAIWASTVIAPPPVAQAAGGFWNWSERCVMKKINAHRNAHGLHPADWDPQLGYVGRKHARVMSRYGTIWHDGAVGRKVTRWYRLGQNTARARGCRTVVRSFLRSSTHRANIYGRWGYIGAGIVRRGDRIYVQILFESSRNPGNIWGYPNNS
jgi:uncharacterized protein YkwD